MPYKFNPFTSTLDLILDPNNILGNLIPSVTNTYNVGSSSLKWKNAYFSGAVDIDTSLDVAGIFSVSSGIVNFTDSQFYIDYAGYPTRISKTSGITTIDGDYVDAFGDLSGMDFILGSYSLMRLGYTGGAKDSLSLGVNSQMVIHGASFYADDEIEIYGRESYFSMDGALHLRDYVALYRGGADDVYDYFDGNDWIINCSGASSVQLGNSVYEFHSPVDTRTQAFFETGYTGGATGVRISNTGTASTSSEAFVELANTTSVTTKTSGGMWSGWDNTTDATRTSYLTFKTLNNGSLKDILKLGSESVGGDDYALVTGNLSVTGTVSFTSITSVTSLAELTAALTASRPGSLIQLAAGTYNNSAGQLTIPSGVSLEGVGSGSVSITGTVICDQAANEAYTTYIKGITINSTGATTMATYGMNEFKNGKFVLVDVIIYSNKPASKGNCVTFSAYSRPVQATMINCTVYGGERDGISTKASSTTYGAQSFLTLKNVYSYDNGAAYNDQALTSHDKFRIEAYNCVFTAHTAAGVNHPAVVQESVASPIALYSCRCYGEVIAQTVVDTYIELVTTLTNSTALTINSGANGFVSGCVINGNGTYTNKGIHLIGETGDKHIVQNCEVYSVTQNGTGQGAIFCDMDGTSELVLINNDIHDVYRGVDIRNSDTTSFIKMINNKLSNASNYAVLSGASYTNFTTSCNYFSQNLFYLFTPSSSDILKWEINEDTEITGDFTVTGDIDLTGDAIITGAGTDPALKIYQGADNKGIILYGYDDRISSYLQIYINQYGATQFSGTNSPIYFNDLSVLDNSNVRMGSSSQYWWTYNSTSDELQLWTTNSDGSGTNKKLIYTDDGTDDITFDSNVIIAGQLTLKRTSQSAEPTVEVGELRIWRDSDDNKVYLIYKDTDAGQKKIELT